MSKKKNQTETQTETTLAVVPAVTAEMGVKSDDLIAVAVARRERALTAAMHRATRDLRDLQREGEEAQKALKAAASDAVEADVGQRVEALKAAFAALTGEVKVKVAPQMLPGKGELAVIGATISIESAMGRISISVETPITDGVRVAEAAVNSNAAAVRRKMEEVYALKGELQNIGSTERQARAALAEATLRGTSQGRELLEAMTQMSGLMEVPQIGMVLDADAEVK